MILGTSIKQSVVFTNYHNLCLYVLFWCHDDREQARNIFHCHVTDSTWARMLAVTQLYWTVRVWHLPQEGALLKLSLFSRGRPAASRLGWRLEAGTWSLGADFIGCLTDLIDRSLVLNHQWYNFYFWKWTHLQSGVQVAKCEPLNRWALTALIVQLLTSVPEQTKHPSMTPHSHTYTCTHTPTPLL